MNLINVDGYHAKIEYDEETYQFRGEILGLSGGADFYGSNPPSARKVDASPSRPFQPSGGLMESIDASLQRSRQG